MTRGRVLTCRTDGAVHWVAALNTIGDDTVHGVFAGTNGLSVVGSHGNAPGHIFGSDLSSSCGVNCSVTPPEQFPFVALLDSSSTSKSGMFFL